MFGNHDYGKKAKQQCLHVTCTICFDLADNCFHLQKKSLNHSIIRVSLLRGGTRTHCSEAIPAIILIWSFCCCCLVTESCLTLLRPHGLQPTRLLRSWDFPRENARVGYRFLLQGISPIQGSNPHLLHWQQEILYH